MGLNEHPTSTLRFKTTKLKDLYFLEVRVKSKLIEMEGSNKQNYSQVIKLKTEKWLLLQVLIMNYTDQIDKINMQFIRFFWSSEPYYFASIM